jgi:predicted O-methyltransferase YrrM
VNLHAALKYLEYSIFSTHRKGHGIHSPFVFYLIAGVFRNKTSRDIVFRIEKIRKSMLADNRSIEVNDMGAGSAVMRGKCRKVSEIARYSSLPQKYGSLLSGLASHFGSNTIIELGTSLGISTMYLASGSGSTVVHTIEGCSQTSAIASENFKKAGFRNIRQYNLSFDEGLSLMDSERISAGLVFIDGDHRKERTLRYFQKALNLTDERSLVIVDDIHLNSEMSDAWEQIKGDSRVTCSIDINRMGLLFFRKGLTRTDYVIRY